MEGPQREENNATGFLMMLVLDVDGVRGSSEGIFF